MAAYKREWGMKFYVTIEFVEGPAFGMALKAMCEETATIIAKSWAVNSGFTSAVKSCRVVKL